MSRCHGCELASLDATHEEGFRASMSQNFCSNEADNDERRMLTLNVHDSISTLCVFPRQVFDAGIEATPPRVFGHRKCDQELRKTLAVETEHRG